jgi:hypothetical protein
MNKNQCITVNIYIYMWISLYICNIYKLKKKINAENNKEQIFEEIK